MATGSSFFLFLHPNTNHSTWHTEVAKYLLEGIIGLANFSFFPPVTFAFSFKGCPFSCYLSVTLGWFFVIP